MQYFRICRAFLNTSLLVLVLSIFSVCAANDQALIKQYYRFHMGVYYPSIANLVTRADFKTAINVWLNEFAPPLDLQPTIYLFENIDAMQQAFNNGELDFIMAPPIMLAEHIDREKLADGFVGTSIDGSEYGVVLLARKDDQHINNLKYLAGKRVVLPEKDVLAEVFLDSLALKTFHQHYQKIFQQIMTKERQSEVILSLFFNQADVAIANREIYYLMVEMNPQIQNRLEVLSFFPTKSPNYGYFHNSFPEWLRNKINQKVVELNDQPRAQQILTELRIARLEPCPVDALRIFDSLISEYHELQKGLKK